MEEDGGGGRRREEEGGGGERAAGRLRPAVRHSVTEWQSDYATPALRLTQPQPKATQNEASQNLEWPSFPGRRTPGMM